MNKFRPIFIFASVFVSLQLFSQKNQMSLSSPASDEITILPEVLLTFDAIINDNKVELTWASNTGHNNNCFIIEKSKDAIAFDEFLKIKNFGNNSNIISYFDVDYSPYEGSSYYRLLQTDETGHKLSSRIVSVTYKADNSNMRLAHITSNDEMPAGIEELVVLRNEKGEESFSKVMVDHNNSVKISSDNSTKLNNGTYVIIASSDNKLCSKIVKVQ